MASELKCILKEAVLPMWHQEIEENTHSGFPVSRHEIPTEHFPVTSPEHYHYINLLAE
jgi:hypothetical protein